MYKYLIFCTLLLAGCAKGEIITRLDRLEKIADNLNLQYNKLIQADTINYGGAPWVIVGMSIVILIFLLAFYFTIKSLLKHKNLLHLVTCAVQKTSQEIKDGVKQQIEKEVSNGGSFKVQHKKELAKFAIKHNTFAKSK